MRKFLLATLLALLPVAAFAQQQVVFSEVMYNPPFGKPEFIEIWNVSNTPIDIEKWKFTAGVDFQFPNFNPASTQAHFLKPQERIIVSASDAATTRGAYPSIPAAVRVFGPWASTKALDNGGERITLQDRNGVVIATLNYKDSGHWPIAADGTGHSLVLANDNRAMDDWRQWRQSVDNGGSPGLPDPVVPAVGLVISEFHFSPVTGRVDWIELRNDGRVVASASGLSLSGTVNLAGAIPLGGTVAADEYVSFDVDFPTDATGEISLFLFDSSNRVKSAVAARHVAGRDSWQVFPAGGREWYSSPTSTRNAANNPPRSTDVVINEIMADPPSNQRDGEFIELYNRGAVEVNLGGWKLDDAVGYTLPLNTLLPPGGYLVIAANRSFLNSSYPGLNAIGDWSGSLGNNGDNIRLLDQFGNLANEVDYHFGGEWPELANGNGSSLELVNPGADNRFGGAWRDSDESQKSTFQPFTINGGTYLKGVGNGSPSPNDDEVRVWGVSDMHIVMRNIVLRPTAGGANLFVNPNVTTLNNNNIDGWQARGTHWATYHDAEGVHIIATSHGDNKCNHMEKDTAGMLANTQYTLTFEARWIYGKPRLVAQTWDSSWGGTVRVPIPSNLGTPGAVNSRFVANTPPQVSSLLHSPAVPTSAQTVTVTARVVSNTALSSVLVLHRKDDINASGTWNTTAMNDSGTGGDAVAGDGIWTAQIAPATFAYNSAGNYIAEFCVRATAANGAIAELPVAGNAQPGLWATDSQAVPTDLRRMRIVISQYWIDSFNQDSGTGGRTVGGTVPPRTTDHQFNFKYPRLSNRYVPCTFISNENDIYYGCSVRKTGSPFTRQTDANLTRGRVVIPSDRPFRGKTKLYWDNDAGTSLLHNRIARYWLYLFGVPGNQNEVCRVTRNADAYTVHETSEVFDKDMLDRIWSSGSDGQFFEMDDRFWIGDDGSGNLKNQDATWGYKGLDAQGIDNPTWYHSQFNPKSREAEYDYGGLIEWMKQLGDANITQERCERMADTQAMAAYAAVRGYIGDWDNITINRGKNGYMYQRSTDHKWMLIQWDSDLAFQNTAEAVLGSFPGVSTYFGRPFIRRYMNYYLTELLTNYSANSTRLQAWLTAEENAATSYTANASTYTTWSSGRASAIQSFIGTSLSATFTVTTPANNATVATDTMNVIGTAPSTGFSVACVGHPEAVLTWGGATGTDLSGWTLSGVRLKTGSNVLIFRMFNDAGVQVGADVTRTYTKTGNAPPSMTLAAAPASFNVRLGENIALDATGSYDPDGGLLSFTWTVTPNAGAAVSYPVPGRANAVFTQPGVYSFTVVGNSVSGATASITREVLVYAAQDFESFGASTLPSNFTAGNTELLDNYSLNSWYSLNTNPGNLDLQITEVASRPITSPFPTITRPLPVTTDFVLQTDLGFETRPFGSFYTGLYIETLESGQTVRYLFGIDAGTNLIVRRSVGIAAFTSLGTQTFPGGGASGVGATLRIRRLGTQFQFQRRLNGVWTSITTATVAADATAVRGGIFASTSAAQSMRVAFDYVAVADPGSSASLLNSLRITEIMYNPAGAGGVEFIELRNIGASPIDLTGAYFPNGTPFDLFTFPNMTLESGTYCIVTNDIAGFQAMYGNGATIAGQYTGALNNSGEQIVLRDANGNTILDFFYNDDSPWPAAADGTGKSLEIRDPANGSLYYENGNNWIASSETGGSPGYLGFAFDSDGDGQPDTYETVFGSNASDASSLAGITDLDRAANGDTTINWTTAAGRAYTVECCDDLTTGGWTVLGNVNATFATCSYIDTTATSAVSRCYRIRTAVP